MAQRVEILLDDDLDGGKAEETITFGLDGTTYEIDLSKKNAKGLRDSLATYVGAGRRVGRAGKPAKPLRQVATGADPKAVRAWAKANKIPVTDRGRIPQDITEKFLAAGN